MAILQTQDLVKEYKSGEDVVRAVNGISITVEEGEFVSVVGPSGSGKSTLLYLLGLLE